MELNTKESTFMMYAPLYQYCEKNNFQNSLSALPYGLEMHKNQIRKGGEPYYIHPLTMACWSIYLKLQSDELIAAILLHDGIEDCGKRKEDFPVSIAVQDTVSLLSFEKDKNTTKELSLQKYFQAIMLSPNATMGKLIDRTHNLSTMIGAFPLDKMAKYVIETIQFIYPFIEEAKKRYPNYLEQILILQKSIYGSVNEAQNLLPEEMKRKVRQITA